MGARSDANLPEAYAHRGIAYCFQGDYDRAQADLDVALVLEPELALAHYYRGIVHYARGAADKAIADLKQVASLTDEPTLQRAAQDMLEAPILWQGAARARRRGHKPWLPLLASQLKHRRHRS